MIKMYVYCETCEDWHIIEVEGLKVDCVIICGHTVEAGMHGKVPKIKNKRGKENCLK